MAHLIADRQAAGEAEYFRHWGELLKIHGARAVREQPGASELRVPDEFSAERAEVSIPFDPSVPLAANIAGLFRQFRKRRDAAQHIARRIAETEAGLAAARAAASSVEATMAVDGVEAALRGWQGQSSPGGGRGPRGAAPASQQRRTRGKAETPRALERFSSDGFPILVGRSAADNDALTFHVAKGRDWWLHALGFPGSHVVVRNDAGGPLPPATLREAAWLAAYYSKARRQGQVEVAYVERKHVRRIPKAPLGQVTYSHGHTLWVDVGDARLKRVLDIQGEDEGGQEG
jgi:predicted ribosome quality control (RQC) complex YloA/Tae2 family protein